MCIIFTGQVASKADGFRQNRQKSPKARAHSGERAPKLKVKLTTQFRQPHLSALIAHSRLEFSLNHLVLLSNTYLVTVRTSVSNVVELPGAGLGRMITINSEFNGTTLELVTLTLYYMQSPLISRVGLRRTCAYYRTSARAMCVRKCVRKGFVNCACVVGACGHIFDLRCAIALFILVDRGADEYVNRNT